MKVLKTVFFMVVLLFLVLMGVHNRAVVNFELPPVLHEAVQQPAALMYFGFFAVGVITGTLAAGHNHASGAKPDKTA